PSGTQASLSSKTPPNKKSSRTPSLLFFPNSSFQPLAKLHRLASFAALLFSSASQFPLERTKPLGFPSLLAALSAKPLLTSVATSCVAKVLGTSFQTAQHSSLKKTQFSHLAMKTLPHLKS